jgi:xylan 1,4-beta-xylosidase
MLAAFRYKENFSKYSLYIYRIRIATLFLCCLATGVFLVLNHSIQTQPNQNVIYIDCSKRLPPAKSMIGFLHSLSLQSPPSKYITELNPRYWRIGSRNKFVLHKIKSFGVDPIFVLSDVFEYPHPDSAASWKSPGLVPDKWNYVIKSVAVEHNSNGITPIYDIWNEPNGKGFWPSSQSDFFATFKKGYDQIRASPNGNAAKISGPSISKFDLNFIQHFLDYCLANNLRLDILSWHEFRSNEDIPKVADDILLVKSRFINNPKYAALQIKAVQINEIIPESDQFSPGNILAYFGYLEQGGADGACKACWIESNGESNCYNNSLDGLLDGDTKQPRAAWWAYRYYNLSLENRLNYKSNNSHVICFANYQTDNLQVLLGYYGHRAKNAWITKVKLNLSNIKSLALFAGKSYVNISVLSIPNTGEEAMDSPKTTYQTIAKVANGQIIFSVPGLYLSGACVVNIK